MSSVEMSIESDSKKTAAMYPVGSAHGPLAGTSYDFRSIFPGLVKPVETPRPVNTPKDQRASRRSFFRDLTPHRPKQKS
jgi:hypothetical protein